MLTSRGFMHHVFRGAIYEAEDVLLDVDDVDLIALRPARFAMARRELHKKLVWRDFTNRVIWMNLAFRPAYLDRDYDLFVAYLPLTQDLTHLSGIRNWKRRCRTSICWVDEVWAADMPRLKSWLSALDSFDHIAVGYLGTVEPLSATLGRPCHYVPMGVDAIRFSPFPGRPRRCIDILSIGRRRAELHRACAKRADEKQLFYLHDTINASYSSVEDHREHRDMLASKMKRSRYFVVAPAKIGTREGTRGQVEVGLRYYEGAAAGAVMIGQAPVCDAYRMLFDWPDAVVELKLDASDFDGLMHQLESDPERLESIGRRNAERALLQHDWVYRWERILEIAGFQASPALLRRKARLMELAQLARTAG